jgi:hypothetical protein
MRRWLIFAAFTAAVHSAWGADGDVATYKATYSVEYKGKEAGVSDWSVRSLGDDRYEFLASITAKGMLKLIRPKPTVERSQFRLEGGALRPLEYWFEDGSRSGEDNWHVVFDWQRRVATVTTADARRELNVPDVAPDIGTLKAAVMRDLVARGVPGPYQITDEDSIGTYEYTDGGAATLQTGIGSLETRIFVQQRAGSSRSTWMWVAPTLGFLPVRVEQRRNNEVQTAFLLKSVDGLSASPPPLSSSR